MKNKHIMPFCAFHHKHKRLKTVQNRPRLQLENQTATLQLIRASLAVGETNRLSFEMQSSLCLSPAVMSGGSS